MKKALISMTIVIFFAHNVVFAYDMSFSPSLSVSVTWDDNIEDEPIDEKEDFFLSFTPRFALTGRSERSTFSADASVSGEVYHKFEEFNEISSYRFRGAFDYDPSELTRFNISSSFIFTPSAETERETVVVGEEGGVPDATVITRRVDRYRLSFSPSLRYIFTERFSSTLRGSFRTTQYSEQIGDVTDSITYVVGGGLFYALTRKTTSGIDLSFSTTDFDEGNDDKVYTGFLSLEHIYSRVITLSASGGVSYITSEFDESRLAFIGGASSIFRFKRSRYLVTVDRSIREGAFGDTITRDRIAASGRFPLSRRVGLSLRGGITRRKSSDGDEDVLIKSVSIRTDYRPLTNLSLFIRASHSDQDERALAAQDVRVSRVSAGFSISSTFGGRSVNK